MNSTKTALFKSSPWVAVLILLISILISGVALRFRPNLSLFHNLAQTVVMQKGGHFRVPGGGPEPIPAAKGEKYSTLWTDFQSVILR